MAAVCLLGVTYTLPVDRLPSCLSFSTCCCCLSRTVIACDGARPLLGRREQHECHSLYPFRLSTDVPGREPDGVGAMGGCFVLHHDQLSISLRLQCASSGHRILQTLTGDTDLVSLLARDQAGLGEFPCQQFEARTLQPRFGGSKERG